MNTSALKRFAQEARTTLKTGIEKQLIYWGYNPKTKNFTTEAQVVFGGAEFGGKLIDDPDFYIKWKALQKSVMSKGADQVVEQAAYTWFNRLMAIQILAKNGYIVPQLAYASAETRTPLIVQAAKRGINPKMNSNQKKMMNTLIEDDRLETELFALLITSYCHEDKLLQRVFGRMDDFTELLLPSDILATKGFIDLLNTTDAITDDDYKQVELIGWLYQFYISEKKKEVFKNFKNKKKAQKEDIPAATQIFTPNWIVKYMVQNTVGRIWLDLNPDSRIREQMKYLVENPDVKAQPLISDVAQLKLLDPACGSGHILVEGFDLLYAMYREEGYSTSEAVKSIFDNNLWGLDIDSRATQLSSFALLLKAAAQDRTVLERNILPHIYAMPETQVFTEQEVHDFLGEANLIHADALSRALELMQQSQNLGSIMKFTLTTDAHKAITQQTTYWTNCTPTNLLQQDLWKRISPYMLVLQVLTQKYEAVAANPPYMGQINMNNELKVYINSNYSKSKSDLFAVFMEVIIDQCLNSGYFSLINQQNWMFLSSYEVLRNSILQKISVVSLAQLGNNVFEELSGEVVQSVMFVFKNDNSFKNGIYFKLDIVPDKEKGFLEKVNCYNESLDRLSQIPRKRFGFWVSEKLLSIFFNNKLSKRYEPKSGVLTGKDALFVRNWYEVIFDSIDNESMNYTDMKQNNHKWSKISNGGKYRRWYGNLYNIVNLKDEGNDIRLLPKNNHRLRDPKYYHKKGINWTLFLSGNFSVRLSDTDLVFGNGSRTFFPNEVDFNYLMGLFNTKVVSTILDIYNPTTNFVNEDIGDIPLIYKKETAQINNLVEFNISISKYDWDSRETSWNFEKQPLINMNQDVLETSYETWKEKVTQNFYQLHANETELNRIFIDIYGLQDELTPEVKLKNITILQDELNSSTLGIATEPMEKLPIKAEVVMRQLISYFMGCIMGRYRLNKSGLHIAHPIPSEEEIASYIYNGHEVEIDDDAIVPLMDNSCSFGDNALTQIKTLLEIQWGADEKLVETINYLEAALGKELESYLVKDFWKDHCQRYQKRPIYWLFASPKGAFQVLTYMHRMNKYTVEKIRKYLLRHISNLENRVASLAGVSASLDRFQTRDLEKLQRDLQECRDYDLVLKDVADHQIEFDLDDGVVVNYQKFESVVAPIK